MRGFLFCLPALAVSLSVAAGADAPTYTCYRLGPDTPLTIDGRLDDWPDVPFFILGAQDQVVSGTWGGPEDALAKVRLCWDRDTLYMGIEVSDDDVCQATSRDEAHRIFMQDSIQWAVDLKDDGGNRYGDDNYEYGFGVVDGEPLTYRWFSSSGWPRGIAEHVALAIEPNPRGGLIYEAAVDFSMLAPLRNPEDGRRIGFTLVLQDMDRKGHRTLEWTPGVVQGKNPSLFGKMVFSRASPGREAGGWLISAAGTVGDEGLDMRLMPTAAGTAGMTPRAQLRTRGGAAKEEYVFHAVDADASAFAVTVPTAGLAPGRYAIRVEGEDGRVLAEHSFVRSDTARLQALKAAIPEQSRRLDALMERAAERGIQTHYARTAQTVAGLFQGFIEEDAKEKNYELALHNAEAVGAALRRAADRLTGWLDSPAGMPDWMRVPELDYARVETRGAHFTVDGRPVLLAGPLGYTWGVRRDLEAIAGAGYNAVRIGIAADHFFTADGRLASGEEKPLWPISDVLKKAEALHISAGIGLLPAKVWRGASRRGDLTLDAFHDIYEHYARRLILAATRGRTFDYTISVEAQRFPPLYDAGHHRDIWVGHLRSSYADIEALNALYGTAYGSFADVPFPDALPEHAAGRYDYTRVRQVIIARGLAWAADIIRKYDPEAKVTGYPYVWTFRDAGAYYEHAIDPELDADCMDIVSCDTSGTYHSDRYAMDTITWLGGYYDLMESIAGDRPLCDGEFHYTNRRKIYPANWSRAIYFQAYLHGLNGSYAWVWVRNPSIGATLLLDANVLLDSAAAALDLQRTAPAIVAFQDAPCDVVLMYSNASSPHGGRENDVTLSQRAQTDLLYEAIYFEGLKVGYVTERMLQQGRIRRDTPLLVPNSSHVAPATREAVQAFAKTGGRVLLVGRCFTHTPQGVAVAPFPEMEHVTRMRGFATAEEARAAVVPYLRQAGVNAPHRPVVDNGLTFPTVEWRAAVDDAGRRYLFLLNMGHNPARVQVPDAFAGARDLLTGRDAAPELELGSLEFVLLAGRSRESG
ncbi:MAG: beta-galactosidase [Lentisphaerae bacterium]|nr:beta-galactosidase [Lentisphaerota bacterium]